MTGMSVPKNEICSIRFMSYIQKGCGKIITMTPFCHKMHHIKVMLLNTKIFCE